MTDSVGLFGLIFGLFVTPFPEVNGIGYGICPFTDIIFLDSLLFLIVQS